MISFIKQPKSALLTLPSNRIKPSTLFAVIAASKEMFTPFGYSQS